MSATPLPTPDLIPEERVPSILARAAELDRTRTETIPVDALRTAALDAGISMVAVDAALAEYAESRVAPVVPERDDAGEGEPRFGRIRRLLRALVRPLKLGGLFLAFGMAGAAGDGVAMIAWLAWLAFAAGLIVHHRPARRATPFGVELATMTLALVMGFAGAGLDEDLMAATLGLGMALLVVGSGMIKIRLPARFRRDSGDAPVPAA